MTETWLRTNRRALAFGLIPPLMIAAIGLGLSLGDDISSNAWAFWLGVVMSTLGFGIAGLLAWQMRSPRIAYRNGEVLFLLQQGPPLAVPVDIVEAFFVGQQPLDLAGRTQGSHATVNLVARLSQRATEWSHREVKPALGRWSDGYVTIHGAWCEPITGDLLLRLNHRLREVHDERKSDNLKA